MHLRLRAVVVHLQLPLETRKGRIVKPAQSEPNNPTFEIRTFLASRGETVVRLPCYRQGVGSREACRDG